MKRTTIINEAGAIASCRPRNQTLSQACLGLTVAREVPSPTRQRIDDNTSTRETKTTTEIVIGFLNEALGIAIIGILRYKQHAFAANGIGARRVTVALLQHAAEEQSHANHLAERIQQLGGKAFLPFEQLVYQSYSEEVEKESLAEMITTNLLAERSAIHNYRAMIASIGTDDPTTRQVLERILAQEEAHVKNLSGLLRE